MMDLMDKLAAMAGILALGVWLNPLSASAADVAPAVGERVASMEEAPPVSGGYSDADLEVEIENALIQAAGVSLTGVNAEARNGFVTLSGTVDSEAARLQAAAIAMGAGATGVRNLLRVEAP